MLCTYDRVTREKTAILHNASDILDPDSLNEIWEMSFFMPANDIKLSHCQPFDLVQWDGGETIYRLLDKDAIIDDTGRVQFNAEHCIATLIDDVIFGTLQIDNWTTRQVIEKILSLQNTKNWVLGDCEFSRLFSYSWSHENLLAALFSVPNRFDTPYKWDFDFSTYPWQVHLRVLDETIDPEFYIRIGRNLLTAQKTAKGRDICTRLYALGYGEGINQLTFADINDGKPYIENAEAIEKYGLIQRIWEDLRFEVPQNLLERAQVLLDGLSKPYETYSAQVAEIEKLTGRSLDTAKAGKIVQWDDLKTYIRRVERYRDQVGMDMLELANAPADIAGSIADLADRQRINSVYAQGATCLYAQGFNDNADATHPATIRFYVPSEARQINKVVLSWYFESFRAYSTGAKSTENQTSTTAKSTDSGGATTASSGSGLADQYIPLMIPVTQPTGTTMYIVLTSSDMRIIAESHYHRTSLPNHKHDFTFDIMIPGHTHATVYGIYEGGRASSARLVVDGVSVSLEANQTEIDIAPLLADINNGIIRRGAWHTIELIPDALTRIVANLSVQLFIQSEGGGLY